jgi:hypothetical protein
MQKVKINKVVRGPQDDGSFDSQNGKVYVTAWLCDVDVDGAPSGEVKIRVGSVSEGPNPPLAKYVAPGGIIVPNKQGIKEYRGKREVYADSKATKDANGDGYSGSGDGGGGSPRGSQAPSRGYSWPSGGDYSFDDLKSLLNESRGFVCEEFGEQGDDTVATYSCKLFEMACSMGVKVGGRAPETKPGSSMNNPMRNKLLEQIAGVIDKAGLRDDFNDGNVMDDDLLEMWKSAGGNETKFSIGLAKALTPNSGVAKADPEDLGDDAPF